MRLRLSEGATLANLSIFSFAVYKGRRRLEQEYFTEQLVVEHFLLNVARQIQKVCI